MSYMHVFMLWKLGSSERIIDVLTSYSLPNRLFSNINVVKFAAYQMRIDLEHFEP